MFKKIYLLVLFPVMAIVFLLATFSLQSPPPATQAEPAKALRAGQPSQSPQKSSFRSLLPIFQKKQTITLIAVGDIMLGRYVNIQTQKSKNWSYPFLKTANITKNADITFGNLEAPFVQNCPSTSVGMIFCAPPQTVEGLNYAGLDVLSLANNHILNYGQKGLEQTINLLKQEGIFPSYSSFTTIKSRDLSFGFLSFDLVTYPNSPVIKLAQENADKVDFLIVSLHWGAEYSPKPSNQQINLAHQIIDAGAKVIIGHHPHVIQPTESYHNGLIFYSLGNFVFDQPWSEETKKGKIAKIVFEGKKVKSFEEIPIYIENNSQPVLLPLYY